MPIIDSPILVRTMTGRIGNAMTTGVIVSELERGRCIREFVAAPRSRYFGDLTWPE